MRKLKHIVEPEKLLLVWQDPASRHRFVIGEMRQTANGVRFRYLPSPDLEAAKSKGFKGYLAFPHFNEEYRLGVMESFMSRLPPRSREDFVKFLEYWNIDSNAGISDFSLLGYTGAALPRDGFRFLPVFPQNIERLAFTIEIAGHRYQDNECNPSEAVRFVSEPGNVFDSEAIRVETLDGHKLGYVMHGLNWQLGKWLTTGHLSGEIVRMNGTSARPVILVYIEYERKLEQLTQTS